MLVYWVRWYFLTLHASADKAKVAIGMELSDCMKIFSFGLVEKMSNTIYSFLAISLI